MTKNSYIQGPQIVILLGKHTQKKKLQTLEAPTKIASENLLGLKLQKTSYTQGPKL